MGRTFHGSGPSRGGALRAIRPIREEDGRGLGHLGSSHPCHFTAYIHLLATRTENSLKDCNNKNELTTRFLQLLSDDNITTFVPPTREAFLEPTREDSLLPSHVIPAGAHCLPSEIETILITGVTGNLGP
jgi:hypothetical protein